MADPDQESVILAYVALSIPWCASPTTSPVETKNRERIQCNESPVKPIDSRGFCLSLCRYCFACKSSQEQYNSNHSKPAHEP
jgi:hypothetical protein